MKDILKISIIVLLLLGAGIWISSIWGWIESELVSKIALTLCILVGVLTIIYHFLQEGKPMIDKF